MVGDVVDGKRKAELLKLIAQVERVDIAQTIAVGDGANDLPMLSEAGLGIAFHAKPKVVASAQQSINTIGLDGVLYFLGLPEGDPGLGHQLRLRRRPLRQLRPVRLRRCQGGHPRHESRGRHRVGSRRH